MVDCNAQISINVCSGAALPPPSVIVDSITAESMSLSFSLNSQYEVGVANGVKG